ncbi:MAG: hypothetical protein BEN19_08935 [Epulopiscium sp. Nuni2H_MBin003]|nr:MAG: hypothetical protein BEN19_08935 [Epulopiscium sp. Nuni2H_MBin003]
MTGFIKFTKIKDIGHLEGNNSTLFLAKDVQLNMELVIKQISKSKFNVDKYFLESQIIYANKHPNVVKIQYAAQDHENIYLAMPYYNRGSLHSLMQTRCLTIREIIKYSLDLLCAITYIHSNNLLHLDIKPTNILLDSSNKALITDFGLSKFMDRYGIVKQPIMDLQHRSPESYIALAHTVQTDIFQIGLTMYQLCNEDNIFNKTCMLQKISTPTDLMHATLKGRFPDRKVFSANIPHSLKQIVLKALSVDNTKRYTNTIQIMNDLSLINNI